MTENENATPGLVAWGMLALLALIWGSSFILIKLGLEVFDPLAVGAIRILTASMVLTPLSLPVLRKLSGYQVRWLFITGLVGSFLPAFLFAIAQTRVPSGPTGVLNALTPIFTLMVGAFVFGKSLQRNNILGIVIGFTGSVIMVMASGKGGFDEVNYFALFVILATVCYGFNVNILKEKFYVLSPIVITSVSLLFMAPFAAIILFGFTPFVEQAQGAKGFWPALGYLSILGVIGTAIALIIFNQLIKKTTPLFASSVTYLIPIVALVWGFIFDEPNNIYQPVGMVFILAGVYLGNSKKK